MFPIISAIFLSHDSIITSRRVVTLTFSNVSLNNQIRIVWRDGLLKMHFKDIVNVLSCKRATSQYVHDTR